MVGAGLLGALIGACAGDGPWDRECSDGADACADGESCERTIGFPSYKVTHTVCAPRCESDDECPPPDAGNAEPRCSDRGVCQLRCGAETACPAGMVCVSNACMWPR
ncbi:MAG: hypothetical protein KC420_04565 [Myxococcales bacterium]|nr:hypothetical protein [Myxococcales bacterium]